MKKNTYFKKALLLLVLTIMSHSLWAQKQVNYSSLDGLKITADLYINNPESSSFIILFHRAGWSRGEYREIAPRLNKQGFNCIAVDQRSGGKINDVDNLTFTEAKKKNLGVNFVDALPDMLASIDYVKKNYPNVKKLLIWGSSYTSALVLKIAGDKLRDFDGVVSFAPGEYFKWCGEPKDYITKAAKNIDVPVFITSAKNEIQKWKPIYDVISTKTKVCYIPKEDGIHGAQTLWKSIPNNGEYWTALTKYLKNFN